MICNTDGVNQEAETQNLKMIDFSLWESRIKAVNDFITHYSFDTTGFVIVSLLGFLLVASAMQQDEKPSFSHLFTNK